MRSLMVVVSLAASAWAATPALNITLKADTPRERRQKAQLERLAAQYDLERYTRTRDIVIEQGGLAHAYPVLTMNCRFVADDDLALSQFLHEQGHWVLQRHHPPDNRPLLNELRRLAPGLPLEYPGGSGDLRSTYYHLVVNLLEWRALEELIGPERARRVIDWKQKDHYTAIYAADIAKRAEIEQIMQRYRIRW